MAMCQEDAQAIFIANETARPYRFVTNLENYPNIKESTYGKHKIVKVLDTSLNLEYLLGLANAEIRLNLMTRSREIDIPRWQIDGDEVDKRMFYLIHDIATINDMPTKSLDDFLDIISYKKPYHPIVECIANNPWDGVNRLDNFINTLESSNPKLDRILIKTWMRAAIAAAHSADGFTQHGVLVLQSAQGIGKTEWIKKLDPINCGAIKTAATLDPKDKDSIITLARYWIVELGELDGTFNKSDIALLKGYVTSDVDKVRVPWGRKDSHLVRRTAYVATVNNPNYLIDDTGNRRWWTVSVIRANYRHNFDMQQVWAEVKADLDAGGLTYLPDDIQAQINEQNKSHERIEPLRELLEAYYDWSTSKRRELTATQILIELGYSKPTQGECTRMGKILTEKNKKPSKRYLHEIPEKLTSSYHV